ncbi:MAG: hypothetical protein UZ22_OP11002000814 [Microgenomates bacterium OLB23]|nr:MAG: hypothetical protein UZ22_OP11002000814 [Microgenomates bacterium OLB23]
MVFSIAAYAQVQNIAESGCMIDGVPTLKCLEVLFQNLIFLAGASVVLILFIMLVIGAFKYLTSAGDEEKLGAAKKTITYAFLGLFLFMGSYLILNIIQTLFIGPDGPSLFEFRIPEFEP